MKRRLGVAVIAGDVTDPTLAAAVLREIRPTVRVLNAGATPVMAPLHEQTWEGFSSIWNQDVKAGFHWIQAALRLPLPRDSRVLRREVLTVFRAPTDATAGYFIELGARDAAIVLASVPA